MGAICFKENGWLTLHILSINIQAAPSSTLNSIARNMGVQTLNIFTSPGNQTLVTYPGNHSFIPILKFALF